MSGGSDTTNNKNVTNTGLGDKQYKALQGKNNKAIQQNAKTQQQVGQGFAQTSKENQQLKTVVNKGNQAQQQGFANNDTKLDRNVAVTAKYGDKLIEGQDAGFGMTAEGLTNLSEQTGEGFAATGEALQGLGAAQAQGFEATNANLNSGFENTAAQMDAQAIAAEASRQTGFTSIEDLVSGGFGDAAAQLTAAQKAILDSQSDLSSNLDNTGQRLDTYAGGLLEGQAGIQGSVDTLQGGFNDFTTGYDRDVNIANEARADIQTGLENGVSRIREDVGAGFDGVATGQQKSQAALMSAVGGVAPAAPSGSGMQPGTGQAQGAGQGQARPEVAGLKQTALKAAAMEGLDPAMRSKFKHLGTAFDDQGELIRSTTDVDGNTAVRSIDEQGNLIVRGFAANGRDLGSTAVNIPQSIQQLQNLRKPAPTNVSGFLSPYAQTR